MKFIMALFVGLATLVWGGAASINWTTSSSSTTRYSRPTVLYARSNSTTTLTIPPSGYHTGPPSVSQTATSTTSAEPSVYTMQSNYTVPGNESVQPVTWTLPQVIVYVDSEKQIAQYTVKVEEAPNMDDALCITAGHSPRGKLDGFDDAECYRLGVLVPGLHKNHSIPYSTHFAWRSNLQNNRGEKGNLLVVKSNSPGSDHACPLPPYDVCWAQGLHWIPEEDIGATDKGLAYYARDITLGGTYCRTGMPECAWSEYLY